MKTRKSGLLQRMMAVLLAAVLVVGMASDTAPMTVLAQEDTASLTPDGQQEITEGNTDETLEGDTEPEETDSEEETPNAGEGVKEETSKPDEEPEPETPASDKGTEEDTPEPEEETETNPEEAEEIRADEAGQDVQALLARIAALPDAEEYLATEPDADDWVENEDAYEDAYTEWMAGLYEYADEALAIQEEVEKLTEEQRSQISEEELQKLAAWAEAAQTAGESAQMMLAAEPAPQADLPVTRDVDGTGWTLTTDGKLTISSDAGMGDWISNGRNTYKSQVTSAEIQDGVTSIWPNAFYQCSNLTKITIPSNVTSIGNYAFNGCSSLEEITIPGSVTSIGLFAFDGCSNLKEIRIPGSVTSIEKGAFNSCRGLTKITIPEGVTSIGESMFSYCSSLEEITIPASVTSIEGYAFSSCVRLETVTMLRETPPTLGSNVFGMLGSGTDYRCGFVQNNTQGIRVPAGTAQAYKTAKEKGWETWAAYITDGTTTDNIASGDGWALGRDGKLTIRSDAGMTAWTASRNKEYDGTAYKKLVKSAEIQSGVTSIGENAFKECYFLSGSITIPEGVKSIGDSAFFSCASLTGITISASVTSIGEAAFFGCTSLATVTMQGKTPPSLDSGVFGWGIQVCKFVTDNTQGIRVPVGTAEAYKTAWTEWANYITEISSGNSGSGGNSGGSGSSGGSGDSDRDDDHSGNNSDSDRDNDHSDSGNNNNDNGGFAGDGNTDSDAGGSSDSGSGSSDANAAIGSQSGANAVAALSKAPATVITTPQKKLEEAVLTAEEKQRKAAGADIRIELDVKAVAAEAAAADKAVVEAALKGSVAKGYTLGQYLAISLYKVAGDSRTAVTETQGKITVRIDVPESLKNTDSGKVRTFAVIRVHEGKAQLLADLDQEADTITIETDRFSTYAVVYKDTAAGGKDDEPKTGDNTPLELSATLAMIAGFAYLLLYFTDRERGMTEERKKELVSCLVAWAKQGGRSRKYLALAAIFVLLVYYHSIGKKTCVRWKAIYGE